MRDIRLSITLIKVIAILIWTLSLFPSVASAQAALQLEMSSAVQTESLDQQGNSITRYVSVDSVEPGSKVSYTINYENTGDQPANNSNVVGVIPENALFLEVLDNNSNSDIEFSVDQGENFSALPFSFILVDESGGETTTQAEPQYFTHIKFLITTPVAPGVSGNVSFLVQIN